MRPARVLPVALAALVAALVVAGLAASGSRGSVVVGATAPVLQDRHPTAESGARRMAGPELQANAIWTALHEDPLRDAPAWAGWPAAVALLVAGLLVVLVAGPLRAGLAALAAGGGCAAAVQVASEDGTVLAAALPLTALVAGTVAGVAAGAAAEATKRRRAARRDAELDAAVRERTADLEASQLDMAVRLACAAELRDEDTADHVDRMSTLVGLVAGELGRPAAEARLLRQAAVLHDVGKIGLPDGILRKPGRLTPEERAVMQRHTTEGARILAGSTSPLLQAAEAIARTHHERWDGTGYPAGLAGDAIPLAGRIAAVCDVFDALVSRRPYKPAWSVAEACGELERERGGHFDPAVADALLRVIARRPSVDAPAERDVAVGAQEDDAPLVV